MPPLSVDEHQDLIRAEPPEGGRIDVVRTVGDRLGVGAKAGGYVVQQLVYVGLGGSRGYLRDVYYIDRYRRGQFGAAGGA